MSDLTSTVRGPGGWALVAGPAGWWDGLTLDTRLRVKTGVLAVAVVVAYHYTLSSLLQTAGADTPLAYIGLVPVIAVVLAVMHRGPRSPEPSVHDRELDFLLGVPLLGLALTMILVLPAHYGDMYWVNRLDLLSLPVFVAGATVLLFGTRVAWRQKVPILYLLLAWPVPYTTVLLGALGGFRSLTVGALQGFLRLVPIAKPVGGQGNQGLFAVTHAGQQFPISVVTACSGVDSVVGFLILGVGLVTVVGGRTRPKMAWLGVGLVLLWATNLARLVLILWAGKVWGEHVALSDLHPIAGLVFFLFGLGLMLLLLRPFGLRLADPYLDRASAPVVNRSASAGSGFGGVLAAVAVVAVLAVGMGIDNSGLVAYNPVATAAGEPKLGSFLAEPTTPAGWRAAFVAEYLTGKPLYGQSSRWFRYEYTDLRDAGLLTSDVPVTADVIDAGGLSGFDSFGVAACYSFHGYTLRDVAKVSLGDGIVGQALSYSGSSTTQDWSLLYWIWPVNTSTGTRYERVILQLQNTQGASIAVAGPSAGVAGLRGALSSSPVDRRLASNRQFLVAFAKALVSEQVQSHDTAVTISALHPPVGRTFEGPGSTTAVPGVTSSTSGPDWSLIGRNVHLTQAQWIQIFTKR